LVKVYPSKAELKVFEKVLKRKKTSAHIFKRNRNNESILVPWSCLLAALSIERLSKEVGEYPRNVNGSRLVVAD